MAAIFLDSSALLRRYEATEPDSHRVRAICEPAAKHTLFVSQITSVEMASALQRRGRERSLPLSEVRRIWRIYVGDRRAQYRVVLFTDAIVTRAEELVFAYPLAASDALQLACALAASERLGARARLHFWTGDAQQARAARREGLAVEQLG